MTEDAASRSPRDRVRPVRKSLLRLHKTLIDAERARYERERGPLTASAFLQVLLQDESFEWLRSYSNLILEIDDRLADRENPVDDAEADRLIARVRALGEVDASVSPEVAERFRKARDDHPAVATAQRELLEQSGAA